MMHGQTNIKFCNNVEGKADFKYFIASVL
jgi:hypothetical protein